MSEHLSPLELDELAAGLSAPSEHARSCADCAQKLERVRAQHAAFLEHPQAKAQLERLARRAEAPPPARRTVLRLLAVAVPLAAAAVLVFTQRPVPEDRLKGAPTVMLLDTTGSPVTRASAGQKLTLAVGSAGFSRVKVTTTDPQGHTEALFDGPIAAGARVPLMQLEVTPGDVTVTAEFERDGARERASVRLEVR